MNANVKKFVRFYDSELGKEIMKKEAEYGAEGKYHDKVIMGLLL